MQLVLLALCWLINLSPVGLAVAFLITSLVPVRERLLPHFFTEAELDQLDEPIRPPRASEEDMLSPMANVDEEMLPPTSTELVIEDEVGSTACRGDCAEGRPPHACEANGTAGRQGSKAADGLGEQVER